MSILSLQEYTNNAFQLRSMASSLSPVLSMRQFFRAEEAWHGRLAGCPFVSAVFPAADIPGSSLVSLELPHGLAVIAVLR
jgi:hypothetical protein